VFLLAGVVENATIGEDTSVLGAAVSAVTLVAASRAVRRLLDTPVRWHNAPWKADRRR
jgi:hypothetical protein